MFLEYDALGQLLTETVNGEVVNEMVYDNYGNILQKNGARYTYSEGWNDRLAYYDGKHITYDAQGNPLNYLGHTLAWEKGRELKTFDGISYTYNANGIRTSKTVDGIRHDYLLDGVNILAETWDDNTLEPMYDNEESVCGIVYNGVPYYFHKNLQGDIIAVADQNGKVVARYTYDAWGKCEISVNSTNAAIAEINPYRYRGYYFDTETGFYYLQSRYYDPEIGRFVNGDQVENALYTNSILDLNIFTYVLNNPVALSDSTGKSWITDALKKVKSGANYVWGWIKKAASNIGSFFRNTVWKKWMVQGVWKTFCKQWIWETFIKKWIVNTFIKKWVWQTFCKKWVWQTFCKDWIANKAWNWFNGSKWYQSLVRNLTIGVLGGIVGALIVWVLPCLSVFAAASMGLTVLGGIITGIIGGIVSWLYELIS